MTAYAALLRAVNVGGTGKLAMPELTRLCEHLGFDRVRTYIQSGNVVFQSGQGEAQVQEALEAALERHVGRRVDVVVRTAGELARIVDSNPFPDAAGAKVTVALGSRRVTASAANEIVTPGAEQVAVAGGELFIHYPDGMGRSKLTLPKSLGPVTVRNLNTLTKLRQLADEVGGQTG
ncbi:DUF1697 domain-containing protein [Salinibacterium sp. ZJ454]|uniref:DUF1697 domain-containing protein n=1 Tax=Salinibacterium sp. ZJ454 TaxID=2708339 RepID=UPI00141F7811|nr:DUF1697 domain-containing protein [Salinibacterium sp. ZJ454]